MDLRGVNPEDLICTEEEVINNAAASATDHIIAIQGASAEQSRVLLKNAERVHRKAADILQNILDQKRPELTVVH